MAEPDNRQGGLWVALGFAWRLGYSITIPLVILLLVGRWLDKKFGTSPWLLIAGLVLSFITTNILMFREAMRVMQQAETEQTITSEKKSSPAAGLHVIETAQNEKRKMQKNNSKPKAF